MRIHIIGIMIRWRLNLRFIIGDRIKHGHGLNRLARIIRDVCCLNLHYNMLRYDTNVAAYSQYGARYF